jgi:hypothetical protein
MDSAWISSPFNDVGLHELHDQSLLRQPRLLRLPVATGVQFIKNPPHTINAGF